jgi:leader peptidase (prepilin peptidase)/N-methyltransferase
VLTYELIIAGFFGLFGLAFGSFLNVCIYRLPRRIHLLDERDALFAEASSRDYPRITEIDDELRSLAISRTRSACPHCKHRIAWYDNAPVLSWLILRGRCRHCRGPISPRYMAVELITAAMFIACYFAFDFTLLAAKFCAFSFFLIGLIFTDAEWKLLPDALTLPGLVVGLISSLIVPLHDIAIRALIPAARGAAPTFADSGMTNGPWRLMSMAQSAGGALAGAAFIYGTGVLYMRMRPDLRAHGHAAMGLGDVKLMAMIGAFLGITLTALTMFAASIAGSLFGIVIVLRVWLRRLHRERTRRAAQHRAWQSAVMAFRYFQVPFGVFLGAAALFSAFFGETVVRWYAGFFG